MRPPRWIFLVTLVLVAASWIPFALIYRARAARHPYSRILILPDMTKQPKYRPQRMNTAFADARADRRPVEGTVAQGDAMTDDRVSLGRENGAWVTAFPVPVTESLMHRGHERYGIYCSPCHGLAGDGDGMVAKRADKLQEGTWVPPSSLHDARLRAMPIGQLFNTITNGVRNMPPYGAQIPVADRWAILAYVRALQLSRNAPLDDVPSDARGSLQ
jgi:mono/diheme cytochrome c family protein